jgi:hypothetical protein
VRAVVWARGVRPEDAWAWWTDFREGEEDHRWAAWAEPERTVERLGPGHLRLRERARVGPLRFEEVNDVQLAHPVLRFDARNTLGRFRGAFRFLQGEGGTCIEVAWEQELARPLRWLGPLGRALVRRFYAWDLEHHVRDLEGAMARPESS